MAKISDIIFLFTIYNFQLKTIHCAKDGVVQEKYNIFLKDNDNLKVDLDISEDNYEIISTHPRKSLINLNKDKIFEEFNEIARREYERAMERNLDDSKIRDKGTKSKVMTMYNKDISNVRLSQTRKRNATNGNVEYDFASEYYAEATSNYSSVKMENTDSELLDSLMKFSFNTSPNCTEQKLSVAIKAIKSFLNEFYTRQDYKNVSNHIWKISSIWVAVYLVIAVPLWFTRGWCSCCLCCKFFKPQQTIQEAKNYLLLNPPGILVAKGGGIINYEPTEREKDCYEEFGHFLRTL